MKKHLKGLAILIFLLFMMACTPDENTATDNQSNEEPETGEQQESTDQDEQEQEDANQSKEGSQEESEDEPVGRKNGPGGFLWKVEDDDTTVYLQGTIHVGPKSLYPLHTKIEQAYQESDVVVPEININKLDLAKANKLYKELGEYHDGTTIKDHISPELYGKLKAKLEKLNMNINMVKHYKPWLISSLVRQLMVAQLGYTYGVDKYFLNKAMMDEKEIVPLETMEQQLNVLASASEDYQIEMLKDLLVNADQFEKHINEMLDIYREGDVDALLDVIVTETEESHPDAEAFLTVLNDERNYKMADEIMTFLEEKEKTFFVIVGSAHLTIEPHIGSILEENGYEVVRVH